MNNDLQALNQIPPAELERLLKHRDQTRRNLASGRSKGHLANKARAEAHRRLWTKEALRILYQGPALFGNLRKVAQLVSHWCAVHRVTLSNGRAYKTGTIYTFLAATYGKRALGQNGLRARLFPDERS
jgi:hypothetical protein